MDIKKTIKTALPDGMVARMRWLWQRAKLRRMSARENRRFLRNYASPLNTGTAQTEAHLTFYVHQIEKGFTYDTYSYGRGKDALRGIARMMRILHREDPGFWNNPVIHEAILALGEYRRRHAEAGKDTSFLDSLFPDAVNKRIAAASEHDYPSIEITLAGKQDNATATYKQITERRHAVRSYSDEPVAREELEAAVEDSLRTPSVCNRQPTRIRIIQDKDAIAKAFRIQGGFGGYATPPALLVVTGDLRVFMGPNEHNEAYTDGGLFAMSLLYSLEAHNLAACPLNTMFTPQQEKQTRGLLHIPDNEVFVMYIAVGHFKPVNRICRSKRLPLGRVLLD